MRARLFVGCASPRRRQILQLLGVPFPVGVASADEDAAQERYTGPVEEVAQWLAKHKAASALTLPEAEDRLVITADTTVILRAEILGKPRNEPHPLLLPLPPPPPWPPLPPHAPAT